MTYLQSTPTYVIIIANFYIKTSVFSTCSTKNQLIFVHFNEVAGFFWLFAAPCFLLENIVSLFFYIRKHTLIIALFFRLGYNSK